MSGIHPETILQLEQELLRQVSLGGLPADALGQGPAEVAGEGAAGQPTSQGLFPSAPPMVPRWRP